jgi:hypothetical protein
MNLIKKGKLSKNKSLLCIPLFSLFLSHILNLNEEIFYALFIFSQKHNFKAAQSFFSALSLFS